MVIYGLFLVVSTLGCISADCVLPPTQDIDWSRTGRFYETLDRRLSFDKSLDCMVAHYTEADNGGHLSLTNLVLSQETHVLNFSLIKTSDGHYVALDHPGEAVVTEEELLINDRVLEKRPGVKSTGKLAYFTDYERYILVIECDLAGNMQFWGQTRRREATAADILAMTNKLGELGHGWSEIKLYFSTCANYN